jgi:hypothetical protein
MSLEEERRCKEELQVSSTCLDACLDIQWQCNPLSKRCFLCFYSNLKIPLHYAH